MSVSKMMIGQNLPQWVPPGALHYIAHTENGEPIRELARKAGCHASTILRQIRKVEMRRDDPLVDAALSKLGGAAAPDVDQPRSSGPGRVSRAKGKMPDDDTLSREAMRILRRLCETGAVLAVAADLEKAVVVRDAPGGAGARTAVVDTDIAQAMALNDWITSNDNGRISRYHITTCGRAALADFINRFGTATEKPNGLSEPATAFDQAEEEQTTCFRSRYSMAESPLSALARRRDKKGKAFLTDALVQAGERLREDFELSQMATGTTQNWDHFLTAGTQTGHGTGQGGPGAPAQARSRVQAALDNLGPGLADVALRCCCYLEGLETTEKRLGWSARSGKIVLRIALMRLKRHYDETIGPGGPLIG